MTNLQTLSPSAIKDFLLKKGWQMVQEALARRVYILFNLQENAQIILEMDKSSPSYEEALQTSVCKLCTVYRCEPQEMVERILTFGQDILSIRLFDSSANRGFIPLTSATNFIKGAQQMLLSAACMTLNPRASHAKMSYKAAQEFINKTQFRHTKTGSFILNISCPFDTPVQGRLDEESVPLTRQITAKIADAAHSIVTSIESSKTEELTSEVLTGQEPLFSSNFCDSLLSFYDEALDNDVEFLFQWSPVCTQHPNPAKIQLKREYFPVINTMSERLKSKEPEIKGVFVGTVETLDGDLNDKGERFGDVTLSVITSENPEGQTIKVHAALSAEDYKKAYEAHGKADKFIKVIGKITPGRFRHLVNIESFDLIN